MHHEEERQIETGWGSLTYRLSRKRVKNLNLRLDAAGRVCLSVPVSCPAQRADEFIRAHQGWIARALERQGRRRPVCAQGLSPEETAARLLAGVEAVYPLVAPLGVARPQVRLRAMKSQWGNCHWRQGYITLNTALAACPRGLREYVALHELVHFLHPDHSPRFHACMDRLMPDWRTRRRALQEYRPGG